MNTIDNNYKKTSRELEQLVVKVEEQKENLEIEVNSKTSLLVVEAYQEKEVEQT
jgi:hypothetical protein